MEDPNTPKPEDVANIVDETVAALTGNGTPQEIAEDTNVPTNERPEYVAIEITAEDLAAIQALQVPGEIKVPEEKPDRFGRPTKYSEDILDKAIEYLDGCIDKTTIEQVYVEGIHDEEAEVEDEDKDPEEEDATEKRFKKKPIVRYDVKRQVKLPSIGGLAVYLKVTRPTLYEWAKAYSDFSYIMERLGAIQEERLVNGGISGSYNPTISKVILTKHGYREGIDATTNDKDLNINQAKARKKAEAILGE